MSYIITSKMIAEFEKVYRLNLINSLTGFKSANLIATISENNIPNLAVFSSVVHLGSNPALVGFVLRPTTVRRDTYENIMANRLYTINHIHIDYTKQSHQTSASYPAEINEFKECGLTEEYSDGFVVPFVKESNIKYSIKLVETLEIKSNATVLMIGQVEKIYLKDKSFLDESGNLNLTMAGTATISGLYSYHQTELIQTYEYLR